MELTVQSELLEQSPSSFILLLKHDPGQSIEERKMWLAMGKMSRIVPIVLTTTVVASENNSFSRRDDKTPE